MKILVTGNAGFIGFYTAKRLPQRGDAVIGLDVVNDYYDPSLKEARLGILEQTAKETGGDILERKGGEFRALVSRALRERARLKSAWLA